MAYVLDLKDFSKSDTPLILLSINLTVITKIPNNIFYWSKTSQIFCDKPYISSSKIIASMPCIIISSSFQNTKYISDDLFNLNHPINIQNKNF